MRMFLVGALSLALIGCSCPFARQAMPIAAAGPPIELKRTALKSDRARTNVASKNATKAVKASSVAAKSAKPTTPQPSNGFDKNKIASQIMMQPAESAKSVIGMDMSVGQIAENSDPVMEKVKAMVAAKMEELASVELEDMTRAIRRDPYGQSIDTVCGYVRGKRNRVQKPAKGHFYIS